MSYYEERRADRASEREQDRLDRRQLADEKRKERAEREERARRAKQEARQDASKRKAERKAARTAVVGKATAEGDTIAALVVMACSIAPALYFQITALAAVPGLPGAIAVALAVMLEAGAWVATVAGERAKREGRPVGRFRAAMWGSAAVAGVINFTHAPATSHNWLAYVLAAASLGGVFYWELRGFGRHGGRAGRTQHERREARARAWHDRKRRIRFHKVWRRYTDILAAHPYGSLDREKAWAEAWFDVKGAPLAATAEVLARRVAAVKSVEGVLAEAGVTPEAAAIEMLLADLFPSAPGDDGPTGGTPEGGPETGPRGGAGGGSRTAPAKAPQGRKTLGRKGKQASSRTSSKTPDKPLSTADLDKVRKLADILGGADKLSARNVREAIGGAAQDYAIRLRDAVQAEHRGRAA
ncbi:DUF2637 domain-containing protein [Streptomyces lydicus]|uniref:DUF2637 domain-containing protein n=1 Tax=Streptomyces lydicus TaxID=47763 RepID=UPI000980D107|nr:DUF2637 domain-containing protein [Streptomyces lydicus]